MPFILHSTVYALTDSEMQAAVASQGKEAVSGNVFIWFLCAVAFLKISQKIDSFMSGLGVNVGHTGGSLMSEAMVAARSLGMGKGMLKGFGGGGSSSGGSSGDKGGFLSGGLAGAVGRKINNSAISGATEKGGGLFGKKAFESSLKSGGELSKDVIGSIAKGDMSKTGSITGDMADKALGAYLGYDSAASDSTVDGGEPSAIPTDTGGIDTIPDSVAQPETTTGGSASGVQPETPAITGTGIHMSASDITDSGSDISSATGDTPAESGVETGFQPEITDVGSSSIEMQPEMNMDADTGIGSQPEMSADTSDQPDTTGEGTHTGETSIPLSDTAGAMPELPDIVPYDSSEDSGHPVSIIPEEPSSISSYSPAGESESDSGHSSTVADSSDVLTSSNSGSEIQATAVGSGIGENPVSIPQSVTSQPASISTSMPVSTSTSIPASVSTSQPASTSPSQPAEVQSGGGSAPIIGTTPGPSVSSSSNATQSNTVANTSSNTVNTSAAVSSNTAITQQEHISSSVSMPVDSSVSVPTTSGDGGIGNMAQPAGNDLMQNANNIPAFSNVEIGGGRITGTETSQEFPNGIEFGMYNTAQYMKPEGDFTTVKTVDGAKWYKQYATDKVEKTPVVEDGGKIKYEEKIVKKLPSIPRRKDKV